MPPMTKAAERRKQSTINNMNASELEKIHAEISNLIAETGKLNAETGKLNAENAKLHAENRKFAREVFWYPVAISIGFVSTVAGVTTLLVKHLQ